MRELVNKTWDQNLARPWRAPKGQKLIRTSQTLGPTCEKHSLKYTTSGKNSLRTSQTLVAFQIFQHAKKAPKAQNEKSETFGFPNLPTCEKAPKAQKEKSETFGFPNLPTCEKAPKAQKEKSETFGFPNLPTYFRWVSSSYSLKHIMIICDYYQYFSTFS